MSWEFGRRVVSLAVAIGILSTGTLLGAAPAAADEDEEKVAVKDLPEAVVKAINKRFPGAKIEEAEKETEDGTVVYDVEIEHKGKDYDVEVTEKGKILKVEEEKDDADDDDDDKDDDDDDADDADDDADDDDADDDD